MEIGNKEELIKHMAFFILKALILVGMTLFLISFSGVQSFWSDEMSTIGYIKTGTSLGGVIKGYMVDDAVNLPLYPVILYFFYRVLPYGETYLLLPSIFFCMGAVITISKIGQTCFGEGVSLASVCFGSISVWLIYRGAWDIRCYTLLVFLSALALYFYAKRIQDDSWRNILLYGTFMLLLFYTHWFGAMQMIPFAVFDLFLFLRKKVRFRCIISYLVSGGLLLPYIIIMLQTTTRSLGGNNAASDIPDFSSLKETLYYLAGERYICFLLLLIGIVLIGVRYFFIKERKCTDFLLIVMLSFVFLLGGVFCYCACVNPLGTFYENKYFMVALPQVVLIMSYSVCAIAKALFHIAAKMPSPLRQAAKILITLALILYYGKLAYQNYTICYNMAQDIRMPYRQCAEYLSVEGDIYDDNVLVVSTETTNLTGAWLDYYFAKRGFDPPAAIVAVYANRSHDEMEIWDSLRDDEIKDRYRKIFVFSVSFPRSESLQNFLDENCILVAEEYAGALSEYEMR